MATSTGTGVLVAGDSTTSGVGVQANFTGEFLGDLRMFGWTLDTGIRQSFYDNTPPIPAGVTSVLPTPMLVGTLTDQGYQQFPTTDQGYFMPSFAEVFYNRIVAIPFSLEAGNLIADKDLTLSLWNGFFTTSTLDSIIETGISGVTLVGPAAPADFAPLQEIIYTVEVKVAEGEPTLDGSYTFNFGNQNISINVPITASRVLPLPYLFQAGLLETLAWKTKVITSYNGYEQRLKLRGSPRQEFRFDIALPREATNYIDSLFYAWRGMNFGIPVTSEGRFLSAPTSTSSPTLSVDTNYGDFRAGGLAIIYNSETDYELVNIIALDANSITASANITKVFGVTALVIPMRVGRLLSDPSRMTTGSMVRIAANFGITDNTSLTVAASPLQYKGLDVFVDDQLTVGNSLTDVYDGRLDVIDFGTGAVDTFSIGDKTKIQRDFGVQFENLEDAWNHRLWLHRREGKLRPFWMPTHENNLILISTTLLVLTLVVKDEGQQFLMAGRQDIAIRTKTGWVFREILSVGTVEGGLEIGVDSDIATLPEDIEYISFLGRKRLASDVLELNWEGNKTGSTIVPVIEINN